MTPTYERLPRAIADFQALAPELQERFLEAVRRLVADLKAGRPPRPGLRVKHVEGSKGVWEMTFAPDGRATFQYGAEIHPGQPHLIWRRIGAHEVLDRP